LECEGAFHENMKKYTTEKCSTGQQLSLEWLSVCSTGKHGAQDAKENF